MTRSKTIRYLSKAETQTIACPQCSRPVGEPCIPAGARGHRPHNHAVRVRAAARLLGITLPHDCRG
jgi:hypothetical protein